MAKNEDHAWVPEACTLPTVERPLRLVDSEVLDALASRAAARIRS